MIDAVWDLELPSAEATEALGARLARLFDARPGGVIFLHGGLGAGKTTLARGLLRSLGVTERVRSPSYTLIEPYALAGRPVLHLDLYRLTDPTELDQLGLDDQPPEQALWLVEWPEKGLQRLPRPELSVELTVIPGGRKAVVRAQADWLRGEDPRLGRGR
jgi:tRNA threonylcarbamoyladenosine biosynthesis protein TsaE